MAKRVPPLTSMQVEKLKPDPSKTVELIDGFVPGLRLRVTPAGTKSWSLNVRASGIMRRFDVGTGLGLADARKKATDLKRRIQEGADPTAERRASRKRAGDAKKGVGTFGAMVEEYYASGPGAGLRSKPDQLKRIRSVFAPLLNIPALDSDGPALQRIIDAHQSKTSAARAVAYLMPALKWAKRRGMVTSVFDLEKPHAHVAGDEEEGGQRVLSREELASVLPHLNDHYGRCAKFLLLTAVRLEEATAAKWSEVDLDNRLWTVSAGRRKDTRPQNRRKQVPAVPHVIPLSSQAVELLTETRRHEAERRERDGIVAPIGPEDRVFSGEKGGKLENWDRWLKKVAGKTSVTGWSAHTMRRTAATLAGDLGAEPHVVSVMLGHKNVGGQLTSVYSKSRYRPEHKKALEILADELDRIIYNS